MGRRTIESMPVSSGGGRMNIGDLRFQPCNADGCVAHHRVVYRVDGKVKTRCVDCGKINEYEVITTQRHAEKGVRGASIEETKKVPAVQTRKRQVSRVLQPRRQGV